MSVWQFWIDAGGTFTDCIAVSPENTIHQFKTLSSGMTRGLCQLVSGSSAAGSHGRVETGALNSAPLFSKVVFDENRSADPDGFWNGAEIRFLNSAGEVVSTRVVASFTGKRYPKSSKPERETKAGQGTFQLTEPVEFDTDSAGTIRYELTTIWSAPVLAVRYLLGLRANEICPAVEMRFGTTRGTNALLTRTGASVALVTTQGFGDVPLIGNQTRPDLFAIRIQKPEPLFAFVLEVVERVTADGSVAERLDLSSPVLLRDRSTDKQTVLPDLSAAFSELRNRGVDSIALCLMHAWQNDVHEKQLEECARAAGFIEISRSSEVSPLIRYVPRCETTLLDAYLNPILRSYLNELQRQLPGSNIQVMTSSGGLVANRLFRGRDSVLSGPAGGVVGFSEAAKLEGFSKAIGFDMGGTSTDVARYDGAFEIEQETLKAGVRIMAPVLGIETVAAGGGSVCGFDGVRLFVGPQSAGASPGPACYGAGGPLTVTDLNVFLGRIIPDEFPFPLDNSAVQRRLEELRTAMGVAEGIHLPETLESLAEGLLEIANERMAQAICRVSVARGCNPADYLLVCFGGAGGQHACSVARKLGISKVLIHPFAGVLSAWGMGQAQVKSSREASVLKSLNLNTLAELHTTARELFEKAQFEVSSQVSKTDMQSASFTAYVRYAGTDGAIPISLDSEIFSESASTQSDVNLSEMEAMVRDHFTTLHHQMFGYTREGHPLEVVSIRAECTGTRKPAKGSAIIPDGPRSAVEHKHRYAAIWFSGRLHSAPILHRSNLTRGEFVNGPAIICEDTSTIVVEPKCSVTLTDSGAFLLTIDPSARTEDNHHNAQLSATDHPETRLSVEADPVQLEVFTSRFTSIAEQMGETLRRTSISTNVRERLDFSCAVFDHLGRLVVNAPHVPVHLGAMGETVRAMMEDHPAMQAGDVFVTNDPFRGGSHLPDVTVVTPVFCDSDSAASVRFGRPDFYVANRAHHAEIGGIQPGSMPPFSSRLAEEGVLIRSQLLVSKGKFREDEIRRLLTSNDFPTRNVSDNIADLIGQVAANARGVALLKQLCEQHSTRLIADYMGHIQSASTRRMLMALNGLPHTSMEFSDQIDDGAVLKVKITVGNSGAILDFSGSADTHARNLNANRAITTAAVMYAFRCFLAQDVSLNEGILQPLTLIIPEGILNPTPGSTPATSPAIVGGNVETSQRIVDVLLGALNLAAASQGTMNNLTFGNSEFGYYETICGGSGACREGNGCTAVHTHMTNTRLTDPEVLEQRYPVRLRKFSIRRGSGGAGRYQGGDGVIREIEFLAPLTVSMLSQRRVTSPYGMDGGQTGMCGKNQILRPDTGWEDAGGAFSTRVSPGTILRIETPGGGGWGKSL
ncbi:MAG: hydantoinase B/oxoprolinase family protein [Planctomyces sp.]|nr:hydantoinase B/oxoprolinase family protein [Planctomyces sp.]